jgi:rubredoxin
MQPDPIVCAYGCNTKLPDDQAAMAAGWSYLMISRRWRCPKCDAALLAAANMPGVANQSVDPLAPDDRGGLPNPKGFGIVPVAVKG